MTASTKHEARLSVDWSKRSHKQRSYVAVVATYKWKCQQWTC
jgi:hypothetical protein